MPTYEYKCEKCGHQFDEFQSMTDEPLSDCPKEECGGSVHRLISSGAGFLLKGSGFYETDYRSESYKKAAKADKDKATPASSSSSKDKKTKKSESAKPSETKAVSSKKDT